MKFLRGVAQGFVSWLTLPLIVERVVRIGCFALIVVGVLWVVALWMRKRTPT